MIKKLRKPFLLVTFVALTSLIYAAPSKSGKGTVVEINYPTHDYTIPEGKLGPRNYYEKHAFVYLPRGYDKKDTSKKYPLIILMHGSGSNEYDWKLNEPKGELRQFLDKTTDLKDFILVTPSGISDSTWNIKTDWSSEKGSALFGKELRNDLLPYLRENFNISDNREDIAMAGESMGSNQTMTIGIGECLDLIGSFGCFGATPRDGSIYEYIQPERYIKSIDESFPDKELNIKYFFMSSGTQDEIFYPGYCAYVPVMADWKRIESFKCKEYEGMKHEWQTWIQSFKDFSVRLFK